MQGVSMDKRKLLVIVALVVILLVAGYLYFTSNKNGKSSTSTENDQTENVVKNDADTENTINEPITFEIVSPEEETFIPRQARMWKAKLNNYVNEYGVLAECKWSFYLNENNEEVLYKQQDGRAVFSTDGENSCAFTSTFIEKVGKLRAVIDLNVTDASGNVKENYHAERNYIVQ
jgi:hypothetical protein